MPEYLYVLYNWTLWNIAFFISYKQVMSYKRRGIDGYNSVGLNNKKYNRLYILFTLYFLFTFFGGDREAYEQMVDFAAHYSYIYTIDMEAPYIWIAKLVGGNFILWKAFVFGGSLLLIHFSMKRMKVDGMITQLFFVGLCLYGFGATRAILAYTVYVFGLTFLQEKGLFKRILGWVIIISSFFFHNSMIPIILLTPLFYVRLNIKKIIVLLALYPFIQIGFNVAVNSLGDYISLLSGMEGQEFLGERYERYFENDRENEGHSRLYYIQILLTLMAYIPLLYYVIKQDIKGRIPEMFRGFATMSFFVAYFVLILKFCPLLDMFEFYWRYLTIFPFIVFILAVPIYNAERNNIKTLQILLLLIALAINFQYLSLTYNEMTTTR